MAMETSMVVPLLMCSLLAAAFLSETMARSHEEFSDQKHSPPSHHSHRQPECTTPSHGGSRTPSTPSHGGSGTPSTPSHGGSGTPSHGGGSYTPPTTPSHGGGGYYSPPSTPSIVTPPSTPIVTPVTPTPTTPIITPVTPIPGISTPPSPLIPDPNSPCFPAPCTYWLTHPGVIYAIFGYMGTVGNFFGVACTIPFGGHNLSLLDALNNTRVDGIGALYREGTASFLNSLVTHKFPFTTQQVRDAFATSIVNNGAAGAQAELFKKANEGRLKKHN